MSRLTSSLSNRDRFTFIERCLYWRGTVKREDIRERFELSEAAANLVFRAFNKAFPAAMTFDGRRKCYVATPSFAPHLYAPAIADCELDRVEGTIPTPHIARETLDGLALSLRERRAMRIEYTNLKGERTSRAVEPLALITLTPPFPPLLFAYCRFREMGRSFDLSRVVFVGLGTEIPTRPMSSLSLGSVTVPVGSALPPAARAFAQAAFGASRLVLKVPHSALYAVTATVLSLPELRSREAERAFGTMLATMQRGWSPD